MREPFDPPYTAEDIPQLDAWHAVVGLGPQWLASDRRAEILQEGREVAQDYQLKAKILVANYFNLNAEKTDRVILTVDHIYVVWFSKTLQNWKALLSTDIPDGMYYEVTYNGDEREAYIDTYKKWDNVCVPD